MFFYPLAGSPGPDPALLAYVESNGGRNDTITVCALMHLHAYHLAVDCIGVQ